MFEVQFPVRSPEVLAPVIGQERVDSLILTGDIARAALLGRRVVSINSTASGGGVAEMLPVLLAYVAGVDVGCSWLVLEGELEFFAITKRLHHRLHGERGDGGPLGEHERQVFLDVAKRNEPEAKRLLVPGDVVLLHDPQPAGLAKWLHDRQVPLIWRCHIGVDQHNEYTEGGWEFLRPMLEPYIDEYVFTRREYAPSWVPNDRLHVIKPSLDPFAPKNRDLEEEHVLAILEHIGILRSDRSTPSGDHLPVERVADITSDGPPPRANEPMVVQVSRWDPLKDMAGVMRGFLANQGCADARLVLAGPDVSSVSDDPEGQVVLNNVIAEWQALPVSDRKRIQIVCLPMDDPEENALMVNALQRHASIVVQKSLKEGFGLTVTEAMLKGRPVVASAVGGIVDQIRNGVDGILIQDPRDPEELGAALASLLKDPEAAETMGKQAKDAVVSQFLPDSSLNQWGQALDAAMSPAEPRKSPESSN